MPVRQAQLLAVSTWICDRLRAGKPSRYVIADSHRGRLSLLPSVGR